MILIGKEPFVPMLLAYQIFGKLGSHIQEWCVIPWNVSKVGRQSLYPFPFMVTKSLWWELVRFGAAPFYPSLGWACWRMGSAPKCPILFSTFGASSKNLHFLHRQPLWALCRHSGVCSAGLSNACMKAPGLREIGEVFPMTKIAYKAKMQANPLHAVIVPFSYSSVAT